MTSPKRTNFPASAAVNQNSAAGTASDAKVLPDLVLFDAQVVARKDEGWEDMLERVLLRWMWKAVEERRKAIPTPIA